MNRIQTRQISGYAYKLAKKMMPKISGKEYTFDCSDISLIFAYFFHFHATQNLETERAALNAGTGK